MASEPGFHSLCGYDGKESGWFAVLIQNTVAEN